MTKISIIQNLYRRNPYVLQTAKLNIQFLKKANISYQYILFNDNGDKEIYDDVKELLINKNVEYHYSETNYGKKMGTGGWVGAIPLMKGEYVHNFGQDDVMSPQFYSIQTKLLDENPNIYLVFSNGFKTNEKLQITSLSIPLNINIDYTKPLDAFKLWFGIFPPINQVTQANNGVLAPGAIYRTELHDLIGEPDIENFRGAGDFEYWARILFNEYKMFYIPQPLWLYRQSKYTAGNEIIDGKPNRGYWQQLYIERIKEKYSKLWKEKMENEEKK